jgi:hypothetical protein
MVGSRHEREVERASVVGTARGRLGRAAGIRDARIVAASLMVVGPRRLTRPRDTVQDLANLLTRADEKNHAELLATHAAQLLSTTRMLESDPPTLHPDAAIEHLLAVIDAVQDERTGLSFVPAVVRRLNRAMAVSAAHDLLLTAARREVIELRPEGGLGRLSSEELALCPPGPAGTRLSWARRTSRVDA